MPIEIDGIADHVHLLVRLRPVISVSDFLSKLKSNSSGWANRQTSGRFAWQRRYGAFTVSQSQIERVRSYIRNQEKHHSKISFEEEFKSLLRSHGIEFEEKYLWG
jgi:REP element-mobilizing transposase RayT